MATIVISQLFTIENLVLVKDALNQSFSSPAEIAEIEVDYNEFAQSEEVITKNLQLLAQLITTAPKIKTWTLPSHEDAPTYCFNGSTEVPIDMLFTNLYLFANRAPPKPFQIFADSSRATLLKKMFNTDGVEVNSVIPDDKYDFAILNDGCAQIIFDSCDYHSAIDTFIMDIDSRTCFERQIRSLYVHESLKERIMKTLSVERLNKIPTKLCSPVNKCQLKCAAMMAQKYACKIHLNDEKTIAIAFDAERSCVDLSTYQLVPPITVTFFRQISDIVKSLNTAKIAPAYLSVWTENLTTLHTLIPQLNDEIGIIWCNTINKLDYNGSDSKIDTENGYFVNRYERNRKTIQVYIPYDK